MKFGMGTLDGMNHLKNKRIHFVKSQKAEVRINVFQPNGLSP